MGWDLKTERGSRETHWGGERRGTVEVINTVRSRRGIEGQSKSD